MGAIRRVGMVFSLTLTLSLSEGEGRKPRRSGGGEAGVNLSPVGPVAGLTRRTGGATLGR